MAKKRSRKHKTVDEIDDEMADEIFEDEDAEDFDGSEIDKDALDATVTYQDPETPADLIDKIEEAFTYGYLKELRVQWSEDNRTNWVYLRPRKNFAKDAVAGENAYELASEVMRWAITDFDDRMENDEEPVHYRMKIRCKKDTKTRAKDFYSKLTIHTDATGKSRISSNENPVGNDQQRYLMGMLDRKERENKSLHEMLFKMHESQMKELKDQRMSWARERDLHAKADRERAEGIAEVISVMQEQTQSVGGMFTDFAEATRELNRASQEADAVTVDSRISVMQQESKSEMAKMGMELLKNVAPELMGQLKEAVAEKLAERKFGNKKPKIKATQQQQGDSNTKALTAEAGAAPEVGYFTEDIDARLQAVIDQLNDEQHKVLEEEIPEDLWPKVRETAGSGDAEVGKILEEVGAAISREIERFNAEIEEKRENLKKAYRAAIEMEGSESREAKEIEKEIEDLPRLHPALQRMVEEIPEALGTELMTLLPDTVEDDD